MICFTTHNFFLFKRQEVWFYNGDNLTPAGYCTFAYTLEKDIPKNALIEWTSCIDLNKSIDQLYHAISSTFRLHINKAIRSGINAHINFTPSVKDCKRISNEVKTFAKLKGFAFNKHRLFSLQRSGNLCFSKANIEPTTIVTHVYLHDNKRIILLHTYHNLKFEDHKMRSCANKLLHWFDIQEFKKRGFEIFDWGGINAELLPGITRFKLAFGGSSEKCYSYINIVPSLQLFVKLYKHFRK